MTHKARKRFGQNFLQDHNIINNLLSYIHPSANQHWVEIGPGMGALTKPLLNRKVILDVIELDRDLVTYLQKRFSCFGKQLTIHSTDALNFDFPSLASSDKKLRIIGNLPYNISTPLMFHLLNNTDCIEDMHFMLQKEVVDRICAEPGSKKYGRLSIMTQYHCITEFLFAVPPESFDPKPKVMSAILKLTPHQTPPVVLNNLKHLNEVVTQAFSQRRKTIRNSLKKLITEEQLIALNIDPSQRAESLTLNDFAQISNLLEATD